MQYTGKKRKFSLAEQKNITDELKAKKAKYEEDKNNLKVNKSVWSENKRKWLNPFTQIGHINPFVCQYFVDLTNGKSDSKEFRSAARFVSSCQIDLKDVTFLLKLIIAKPNSDYWARSTKQSSRRTICII